MRPPRPPPYAWQFIVTWLLAGAAGGGLGMAVSPYLPTTMLSSLLSPLLAGGALPANAWQAALGLAAYTDGFGALAVWRYRWE